MNIAAQLPDGVTGVALHGAAGQRLALAIAAAFLVLIWFRTRSDAQATTTWGRLCVLGWCAALLAIAVDVMSLGGLMNVADFFDTPSMGRWALAIPSAVGLVALWRPRMAALIVPGALLLLGLSGLLMGPLNYTRRSLAMSATG